MKFYPRVIGDALTIAANFLIKLSFQHRLIFSFIKRDLSTRYLGSTLGVLWAVIHPLVLLISYTFIFAILFRPGLPEGRYSEHFVLYLFAGLLPWLYFQDTVQRSATTLIEHSNLIRRTVFPSEILPVVIAGSNVITHLIGVGLLLVVLYFFHGLSWHLLLIPVFLLLLVVWTLGLAWLVAALTVFLRDTSQFLIVALILGFWFTPIFYRIEHVEERLPRLAYFLKLNPMTYLVQSYQDLLVGHQSPDLWMPLALTGFAVVSLMVGGIVFRVLKREFVDVL